MPAHKYSRADGRRQKPGVRPPRIVKPQTSRRRAPGEPAGLSAVRGWPVGRPAQRAASRELPGRRAAALRAAGRAEGCAPAAAARSDPAYISTVVYCHLCMIGCARSGPVTRGCWAFRCPSGGASPPGPGLNPGAPLPSDGAPGRTRAWLTSPAAASSAPRPDDNIDACQWHGTCLTPEPASTEGRGPTSRTRARAGQFWPDVPASAHGCSRSAPFHPPPGTRRHRSRPFIDLHRFGSLRGFSGTRGPVCPPARP